MNWGRAIISQSPPQWKAPPERISTLIRTPSTSARAESLPGAGVVTFLAFRLIENALQEALSASNILFVALPWLFAAILLSTLAVVGRAERVAARARASSSYD
jgi:hypothetical protein